ncbi:hypothetical protein DY000_02010267 [Brassica cretica]|uniref:Uncharacterized protein n=1 Tax=Brassica cretica TaxID=69181 RepID=A0ABQ7CKD0_BRACR|nr:hypothetical protein DY000_02010267 [Brassica cretica]
MVKTKFTRNGREVMIFGAMRNFDYGSDEAVQESKKGGERDAFVSLSSPARSRICKSVEGISMLASIEVAVVVKFWVIGETTQVISRVQDLFDEEDFYFIEEVFWSMHRSLLKVFPKSSQCRKMSV